MTAKKEAPAPTAGQPSKTRIWDELGKTDPDQTKSFTRPGGFKGTATKPIWTELRMTEYFGPCGIGWGMDKPEFQLVTTAEEVLVFSTVCLWYVEGDITARVYGVGGDKAVSKGKYGISTDDEAFKKSYTDALGNAMKHIGVCADIHMGMFDDNKYVDSMRQEFADEPEPAPATQQPALVQPAPKLVEVDDATAIPITQALESAKDQASLDDIWRRNKDKLAALAKVRPADFATCQNAAKARKAHFDSQQKA